MWPLSRRSNLSDLSELDVNQLNVLRLFGGFGSVRKGFVFELISMFDKNRSQRFAQPLDRVRHEHARRVLRRGGLRMVVANQHARFESFGVEPCSNHDHTRFGTRIQDCSITGGGLCIIAKS